MNKYKFPKIFTVLLISFSIFLGIKSKVLAADNTVVSDTNTKYEEEGEWNDAVEAWIHPNWPTIDGAKWIWKTNPTEDYTTGETVNFRKTFHILGEPLDAVLHITADNMFNVSLNGTFIGTGVDWGTIYHYTSDVTNNLVYGENTLTIEATNYSGSSAESNPAGLIFKLEYDDAPIVYLTSPEDGYSTNDTSVLQTWDTESTDIDYYEYRSCWNNPDLDDCDLIYTTKRVVKNRTVNNENVAFWWQVRGVDQVGNVGEWSDARKIIIDTVPPTATYTHYKNDKLITDPIAYIKSLSQLSFKAVYNDSLPSSGLYQDSFVIFQAQDDGSFRFSYDDKKSYCSWRKEPNLVHLSGTAYETADNIQFTKCIEDLPEGEYYMAHHVYDNAIRKDIPSINQFRDVLGLHFIVDKTHPEPPILTGDSVQYVKWGNVTRSWLPSSSADVDYYMYKNISNGWTSGPYDPGQTEYVITHPTGNYDRIFEWQVQAVDNAGNETWSEDTYRVIVDSTKPTVEITDVDITDKKLSFKVSGTDNLSGARTVGTNIYNENNTGTAIIDIGRLAHDITPETLSVSYDATDIDLSELESGIYTIRAAIRDYSGNIEFATYQITIDNTPPVTILNEEIEETGETGETGDVAGVATKREVDTESSVLGTSTTLPTTGANTYITIFAIISALIGLILVVKRDKKQIV